MNRLRADYQVLVDWAIIGGAWLVLLLMFLLLGRAGYGTGLGIATMGEDQNWIALLQDGKPRLTANYFWKVDGRNPLSPWVYILARPLIYSFTNGLALLQYVIGLLLALATYVLLKLLAGPGGRWFAVSTSTIVAVNQANAYFDHIIWSFQLALCFSILSIAFYIVFLQAERRSILAYGASLCFWSMSLYTYTLQSGAIVAIAICQLIYFGAMARKAKLRSGRLSIRSLGPCFRVFFDIVPFVVTFIIFLLTWVTTTPAAEGFPYSFSVARLISSLQAGLFHQDISLLIQVAQLSPFVIFYVAVSALLAASLTYLITLSTPRARDISALRYVAMIFVVLSIALPTLLVESGGAEWPPGSRWRMIYQMTTPVLMLAIAGAVLSRLRLRFNHLILAMVSFFLLFTSLTFSFAYNERQVSLTRSEAMVRGAMHEVIVERGAERAVQPLFFVLQMEDSFQWLASEPLRSIYMKTWFPGTNVEYRILASNRYVPLNPTRLTFNEQGVEVVGENRRVPYEQVVLLHASEKSVTRRFNISRQDVTSHNGEWQLQTETIDLR